MQTAQVGVVGVDESSEERSSQCGRFLGENCGSAGSGRQLGNKKMERGTYVFEVSDRCILGGHGDSTVW